VKSGGFGNFCSINSDEDFIVKFKVSGYGHHMTGIW
jgi:hypothetical protein